MKMTDFDKLKIRKDAPSIAHQHWCNKQRRIKKREINQAKRVRG